MDGQSAPGLRWGRRKGGSQIWGRLPKSSNFSRTRLQSSILQVWLCHILAEYPDLGVLIRTMGTDFTQLCDEYLNGCVHCSTQAHRHRRGLKHPGHREQATWAAKKPLRIARSWDEEHAMSSCWLCQPRETSCPPRNHQQRQEESHKGALAGFRVPPRLQPSLQHGRAQLQSQT